MKKGTKLKIYKIEADVKNGIRKVTETIKPLSKGGDKPVIGDLMFDTEDLHKPSWCCINNTALIITSPDNNVSDFMHDYVATKLAVKAKTMRETADLISLAVDNYKVMEIIE